MSLSLVGLLFTTGCGSDEHTTTSVSGSIAWRLVSREGNQVHIQYRRPMGANGLRGRLTSVNAEETTETVRIRVDMDLTLPEEQRSDYIMSAVEDHVVLLEEPVGSRRLLHAQTTPALRQWTRFTDDP